MRNGGPIPVLLAQVLGGPQGMALCALAGERAALTEGREMAAMKLTTTPKVAVRFPVGVFDCVFFIISTFFSCWRSFAKEFKFTNFFHLKNDKNDSTFHLFCDPFLNVFSHFFQVDFSAQDFQGHKHRDPSGWGFGVVIEMACCQGHIMFPQGGLYF